MTSIYSSISIEAGLVMHFSGYKIVTFHLKGMYMFETKIFAFSLIKILLNFVEEFILHWLL